MLAFGKACKVSATTLKRTQQNITALEDLRHLSSLRQLNLDDNALVSLEGLTHPCLEELWVSKNQLTHFDGLGALPNLSVVAAAQNPLRSLRGLRELAALTYLAIDACDLTTLRDLPPQLQELTAGSNRVGSLTEFPSTKVLWKLFLDDNGVENLKGLARLPGLVILSLAKNRLTDLVGLPQLQELTTLILSGNSIGRLEGLELLPQLEDLHVDGRTVKQITRASLEHLSSREMTFFPGAKHQDPATWFAKKKIEII